MSQRHDPGARPATAMDRREAIRRVSLMLGGASLVGGSSLLAACEGGERPAPGSREPIGDFTPSDIAFLDEVAEAILPETDTPGAKAAGVGPFLALMVTDTYRPDDQAAFRAGLERIDALCREAHGVGFMDAAPQQRHGVMEQLDREQHDAGGQRPDGSGRHPFRMVKQLTLLGYFTSEIGCTVAQRYVEAPGRYEPCVPYAPGDTTWADHA